MLLLLDREEIGWKRPEKSFLFFNEGLEGGVLIPHSRTFFISFPNPAFLSHKNTLKSLISTKANKCKM